MRLLVYALGGGWGHLTRALALCRCAARRGHEFKILSNSGQVASISPSELAGGRIAALPEGLDRSGCSAWIAKELAQEDWDLLLVDCFPRGLVGELAALLPKLRRPSVWIHRDLDPRYVARFELKNFARHFAAILVPGERAPLDWLPQVTRTEPWLVRERCELLPAAEARRRLGARDGLPLVVVLGAGTPEEQGELARAAETLELELAGRAVLRFVGSVEGAGALAHWPLLELMAGVDLIVGAGGYNTVYEARASATPLLAFPRQRLYDRQKRRLRPQETIPPGGLLRALGSRLRLRSPVPDWRNGCHEALGVIEAVAARSTCSMEVASGCQ